MGLHRAELFHADLGNVEAELIAKWAADAEELHKQHLPPTQHVLDAVLRHNNSSARVLVLLRNPWAAAEAECEASRARNLWEHNTMPHQLAHLVRGFRAFVHGWRDAASKHPDQLKVLEYEVLRRGRQRALQEALRFWRLPVVRAYEEVRLHHLHCGAASCARDMQSEPSLEAVRAEGDEGEWRQWAEQKQKEDREERRRQRWQQQQQMQHRWLPRKFQARGASSGGYGEEGGSSSRQHALAAITTDPVPSRYCARSQQLGSLSQYQHFLNGSRLGLFPSPPPPLLFRRRDAGASHATHRSSHGMWLLQFGKLPVGLRLTLIGPTIRPSAAWLAFGIGAVAVLVAVFALLLRAWALGDANTQ